MATTTDEHSADARTDYGETYMWAVSVVGLASIVALFVVTSPDLEGLILESTPWIVAAIMGDALLVRYSTSIALGASTLVTLAAALVFPPPVVALIGFLSVFQLPGRTHETFAKTLFNRVEIACSAASAAIVVEAFGVSPNEWPAIVAVSLLALAVDASVNAALMLPLVCLRERCSPSEAVAQFFGASPGQTALIYASAALAAPVIALAWLDAGAWGLFAALVAVALAGLALRLGQRVGTAEAELRVSRAAVGESATQIAMERRDERQSLAGDLHDEVLPALFKVHLMGEVIRHDLASGRLLDLEDDVTGLVEATETAQGNIREVVGSLRRSPIGVRGFSKSVATLAEHLGLGGSPAIELDVHDVRGSERALTVAFQVVREALTNAAKYAKASLIKVKVGSDDGLVRVEVIDDGTGFGRLNHPDIEGHFGLELMRERVLAVGGTFVLDSRLGVGTAVTATIPPDA